MVDSNRPKGWIPEKSEVREELHVLYDANRKQIEVSAKRIEKIREDCEHSCDCKIEIVAQQGLRQASRNVLRILAGSV